MERFCFGVLAAALLALLLPALPPVWLPALLLLLLLPCWRYSAPLCGACAYLLCLTLWFSGYLRAQQAVLAQHTTEICGTVVSLPRHYPDSTTFRLQRVEGCGTSLQEAGDFLLDVRWYAAPGEPVPVVRAGQRWQLQLRLKPVRGLANPGTPWREANALVDGLIAVADVRHGKLLADTPSLRQRLYDAFAACCRQYTAYPLWLALTLGERPFSAQMWQAIQHSGLAHLLSISGMHIALLFSLCLAARRGLRALVSREPAHSVSLWLSALMLAWGYAALAGFAVPTLRAVLTLSLLVLLLLARRRSSFWQTSWLLSGLMLLCWPALLLSYSFWLSAVALAVLALLEWQRPSAPGWRQVVRRFFWFQCGFTLLLWPIGLLLFQGLPPLALLVNLAVLPLMTLLAIPLLLLLFAVFALQHWWLPWPIPAWCWQGLDALYRPLLWLLEHCADSALWWSLPAPGPGAIVLTFPAAFLLWFCRGRWQLPAIPLCVPLMWQLMQDDRLQLTVLDVGQGSAALIQRGSHAVLLDVGPAFGAVSATRQVVLPVLKYQSVRQLDYVLISHDDKDHTGDWPTLRQQYPAALLISDIRRLAPRFHCEPAVIDWQGIRLHLLRTGPYQPQPDNEGSCAVLIETSSARLLIPGDIGKAETALLNMLRSRGLAPVDVLILGHHGSQSASKLPFLQALSPKLAIASSGFANQFGHPAAATQARLQLLGIPLYNTGWHGAVTVDLAGPQLLVQGYRVQRLTGWLENSVPASETAPLKE